MSSDRGFRLYGTQADYGIAAFANYDASAPGCVTYRIPVGQYFTGAMQYLTFANDHDVAGPTAQSYFRNVDSPRARLRRRRGRWTSRG
ncbi:MAG: hypothetical protein U0790_02820 [Isosphaeraceae bacterium]